MDYSMPGFPILISWSFFRFMSMSTAHLSGTLGQWGHPHCLSVHHCRYISRRNPLKSTCSQSILLTPHPMASILTTHSVWGTISINLIKSFVSVYFRHHKKSRAQKSMQIIWSDSFKPPCNYSQTFHHTLWKSLANTSEHFFQHLVLISDFPLKISPTKLSKDGLFSLLNLSAIVL